MQTLTPVSLNTAAYRKLKSAIARAIESGAARLRATYIEETLRTHWNIGGILLEAGLSETPSAQNAAMINRLVRDFNRSEGFFYGVAKFRRLYPALPTTGLSWTHYALLIGVDDPRRRAELEAAAVRTGASNKDLRVLIHLKKGEALADLPKTKTDIIPVVRGRLYYYSVIREDPAGSTVLVDAGFTTDRELKGPFPKSLHSGLMVKAVKTKEKYTLKISPFDRSRLYTYKAAVRRVIDGDTLITRIDLGFSTWVTQKLRLRAIDAPELTSAKGRHAAQYVKKILGQCPFIVIKTYKEEKFGRFLCDVFYQPKQEDPEVVLNEGTYLNQELLDKKLAVRYDQ